MSEEIKSTYRDVEITYLEADDRWQFTVNGRERSTESLVKAREAIDRAFDNPLPKEKKWQPFEAYKLRYDYGIYHATKVKVTSVAERSYSSLQVWVSGPERRSKEYAYNLYAVTDENDALIAQMLELSAQQKELREQADSAKRKLAQITVPEE